MEDGAAVASTSSDTSEKMGATNANNAARKAILEDRKRQIEEKLSKCNQELRQLCIQEAELTGITPPEMPLEAGETPPTIRRKVGTAFQLNENLINNSSKDQLIADLELQIQLHKNLRDAALGLANEGNISKTVKRQHRAEYQKHKEQVKALEEKLALLKEKSASEQIKHKKKSRVPEPQEDNVSVITNDPYLKQENRHSHISNKQSSSMLSPTDTYPENRYPPSTSRQSQYHRTSENFQFHYQKPEDVLTSGFYRLSLNGYNEYIERQEVVTNIPPYGYQPQNPYNYPPAVHSQPLHISQMYSQQHSPSSVSQSSPQMSQHSPHLSQSNHYLPHQTSHYSQHSPMMSQHSPLSQHSPVSQHSPQMQRDSPQLSHSPLSQHSLAMHRASQNYSRMSQQYAQLRQSSPTMSSSAKVQYYPSHTIHGEPGYNRYPVDASGYRNTMDASFFRNAHPIQPHQQYENNGMNTGLGGCWKRSESGEMFWVYTSSTLDSSWQRDKRFGSLDRRKNKRVQRRISPVDSKSATLATMPGHSDQVKTAFVKPSQVSNRRSQDHRQLVRTQSLGSVGQTIESVYPSDDTSSCESDNRSFKENRAARKQKEKEWMETSLDGPISPTHSVISRSQSTVPTTLAPEEKYVVHTPPPPLPPQMSPTLPPYMSPNSHPIPIPVQHIPHHIQNISPPPPVQSPLSPKPPLEIPAESNPSPRVPEPPNIELLNNNIPKNCTIVQAGVVKPYHEETKPFEMSDFYKYSTKFKKSPQKDPGKGPALSQSPGGTMSHKNLNEHFEEVGNVNRYPVMVQQQHVQQSSSRESTNTSNLNSSLDLSPLSVSERFSEEMNAWYQDQEHHNDNNNARGSKSRSSATLV